MTLLASFDDMPARYGRRRVCRLLNRVRTVAVCADCKFDLVRTGLKKLAVIGLLVAFNYIRIDLELQHLVLVGMALGTNGHDAFGCELLFGLLDVNLTVTIGTGRRLEDSCARARP